SRGGEADAFVSLRVYVLLVMQHAAGARPGRFQGEVSRRQAADAAFVALRRDGVEVAGRIGTFELPEDGVVLRPTRLEPGAFGPHLIAELRADVREVAADQVADGLRTAGLRRLQRPDHPRDVAGL